MRALIFDLDGTLVDSRADIVASILAALAATDDPCVLSPERLGALVGRPLTEMLATASPGLSPEAVEAAADRYRAHFARHCQDRSRLFPGIRALFSALPGDLLVGVATTKRPEPTQLVLKAFGLLPLLHGWRGTSSDMAFKPAPDVLLAIAEDLDVSPEEMWYVGDTASDLVAARAAGAAGLWATWGYGVPAACRAAEPLHVLGSPADLLRLVSP